MKVKNGEKNKRRDLIYKTNKYKYDFQQYETIRSFSDSIFAGKINIDEAEMNQSNLLKNMVEFNEQSKLRKKEDKKKKKNRNTFEKVNPHCEGRESTLNAFKSGIFPIKATKDEGLKLLNHKQMLQRLPIALAQAIAGNTFENLLKKFKQIIYSLYRAKEMTKYCINEF